MGQLHGLLNVLLGLILLSGASVAFRFPYADRGRRMPRTNLVPPPPPPPPSGIQHFTGGRRVAPQQQQRWRFPVPPTTFAASQSTGRYWPQPVQQQVTSRQNRFRFPMQQQLSHLQPPMQVTSRKHPKPRTLQQNMGYGDDLGAAASDQVRSIVSRPGASSNGIHSLQPTADSETSSNNPPSYIVTMDEDRDICQRCEILNSMASADCCSRHDLCCQQSIPYHSQNQFQQQAQQTYYPLQGPQFGQTQIYQQRNNHPQGHAQVPAQQLFYSDNVNIYNKYDSNFNPGNVEPPYDIRDPSFEELDYPEEEYLTEGELQQEDFDSNRDPRSSLGDLLGGLAIGGISMIVRMAARGGLDDGDPQREHRGPEHRMFG